jgi:hypothetical protein
MLHSSVTLLPRLSPMWPNLQAQQHAGLVHTVQMTFKFCSCLHHYTGCLARSTVAAAAVVNTTVATAATCFAADVC